MTEQTPMDRRVNAIVIRSSRGPSFDYDYNPCYPSERTYALAAAYAVNSWLLNAMKTHNAVKPGWAFGADPSGPNCRCTMMPITPKKGPKP